MELNLRNKQSRELLKNLEGAISLDFDVLRRKLFFSDVDEEKIYMYLPVLNMKHVVRFSPGQQMAL